MKKKGFTLVELLAVIAILAILVIMALPAVLRMFTQARKDLFENEVREMFKTSQKQFLSDSMLNSGQKILYTNAESCSPTGVDSVRSLNMTGNSNLKYYILVNTDGKVLNVRASNGTYSYAIKAIGTSRPIQIENIEIETNNQVTLDSDITNTLCPSEAEIYYPVIADCVTEGCTKTAAETELIIAGERFYVVSSETDGNTVLLSKYDLRQDGNSYIQDTNENSRTNLVQANFLDNNNTAYWDIRKCTYNNDSWSCSGGASSLISPYNDGGASYCSSASGTNCAYVYDENAINMLVTMAVTVACIPIILTILLAFVQL